MHLPTLGHRGVPLRAIPKLARTEIFSDFADALFDVIPVEAKRPSLRADSPERHVNVRVLCVVMRNRQPLERSAKVLLQPRHQIAGRLPKIDSVTKFRGDNYLPKAFIAGTLPTFK